MKIVCADHRTEKGVTACFFPLVNQACGKNKSTSEQEIGKLTDTAGNRRRQINGIFDKAYKHATDRSEAIRREKRG